MRICTALRMTVKRATGLEYRYVTCSQVLTCPECLSLPFACIRYPSETSGPTPLTHCRWGDHLYSKGEYDAAMSQYLETISFLEPSYVIRRFLDAQRIHSLTCYLEQLHDRVGMLALGLKHPAPRVAA